MENGDAEACNVVITSDHGQMDCTRSVNPNVLFVKHGLITLAEDGCVQDWRAWSLSAGMSAHIYLKDPSDGTLRAEVYTLLKQLCEEGVWGFSEVLTEVRIDGGTISGTNFKVGWRQATTIENLATFGAKLFRKIYRTVCRWWSNVFCSFSAAGNSI